MAKPSEMVVRIRVSIWLKAYLCGVEFVSHLTGLEPDPEKLMYWLSRGIKLDLVSGSRKSK